MSQSDRNGKQYWYPNMGNADIIASLDNWGLTVTQQQLLKPTADFVTNVYSTCVQQVMGLSEEDLEEPLQAALASLDEQGTDIYASGLNVNLITYHITRFANAAQVPDFSIKDLYFPTPERTRLILSAFINFVKFSEECLPMVMSLRDRSTALVQERDQVVDELGRVQAQLARLKATRADDEPRCEELRTENAAITAQLIATKDIQTILLKDIEALKSEKATLNQRKESLNSDTALATDAVTRIRSRIVQSPERIKRTITTMGTTANEDKKTLAAQEAKTRDLQAKVTALLNIEKDVRACVEQLQSIEKEVRSLEASQKELADTRDSLDDKRIERTELELRSERGQKQLSNAQEKLERAQRHAEDKRQASQQAIERLQREYEDMALERRDNDKHVEELRGEADEVERKMAEHLKRSEAELHELLAEYWKLRHETEVYMETLANKLGMQVSSV
ncbi:hypothetical protein BV25DRAFT_1827411 [Artomyces pyxidatus]|uniref:Uncharacterized protein n=1 Tax=Artomyces pyxidatus TaxID=48021 RepID=A0ACB8SY25_9AGAM|nr:hypothetical protein BV25DRAFT_1827411 [Artomyces pyxidatus]